MAKEQERKELNHDKRPSTIIPDRVPDDIDPVALAKLCSAFVTEKEVKKFLVRRYDGLLPKSKERGGSMSHKVLKLPHDGNDERKRVVFTPRGVETVSREAQSFVEVSRGGTAKPPCHPSGRMTMARELAVV